MSPAHFFKQIVDSPWLNRVVLLLIFVSCVLVGLETYPQFSARTPAGKWVIAAQNVVLGLFIVEIVVRMGAHGARPWRYFYSPWNVFDFVVVTVCLLPFDAHFASVFRIARLLRTVRMLTIVPELQVLVSALLRAIPSLAYVGMLLLLHFYVYAVLGTFLFGHNDPMRFGSLHRSMMTVFQVLTLEGWNDVIDTQRLGSDVAYDESWKALVGDARRSQPQPFAAALYFVSFILVGTMIMLNLFTGVIISSMEDAQASIGRRLTDDEPTEESRLEAIQAGMTQVAGELQRLTGEVASLRAASDGRSQADLAAPQLDTPV